MFRVFFIWGRRVALLPVAVFGLAFSLFLVALAVNWAMAAVSVLISSSMVAILVSFACVVVAWVAPLLAICCIHSRSSSPYSAIWLADS